MKKSYSIVGVFCYLRVVPGIGYDDQIGERAALFSQVAVCPFYGIITCEEDSSYIEGSLYDNFGSSSISGRMVENNAESVLNFTKTYDKRHDSIEYIFEKQVDKETWIGSFIGKATGRGFAKCQLIPLNDNLFSIKEFEARLGVEILTEEEQQLVENSSFGTDDDIPF